MKAFYLMVDSRVKPLGLMCVFDWKLWNKLIYGAIDSCFYKGPVLLDDKARLKPY